MIGGPVFLIANANRFLGRLRRVDLIISIWGLDVRLSVHPSIRPSAKSFSDSDEIWYVGRGRWVMHDGMPYDPIQGQGHLMTVEQCQVDADPQTKALFPLHEFTARELGCMSSRAELTARELW